MPGSRNNVPGRDIGSKSEASRASAAESGKRVKRTEGSAPSLRAERKGSNTRTKGKTMGLRTGAMPKSNVGRKATPLDATLLEGLQTFLLENPPVEIDDFYTPQYVGPDDRFFVKDHQAVSQGRKYAKAISEKIGRKVSTTPVEVEVAVNGKGVRVEDSEAYEKNGELKKGLKLESRYSWNLYIPLSESREDSGTETAEENSAEENAAA